MLRKVAVHGFIAGQSQADAGGDQPVWFLGGVLANHGKRDLPGLDVLQAFAAGNQFAVGRKNGRDTNDVARRDARIPQCKFKTGKPLTMFTDAFGQKYFLSDKRHSAGARPPFSRVEARKISSSGKVTRRISSVNVNRRC